MTHEDRTPTSQPLAYYSQASRDWVLQLTARPITYWLDDDGQPLHFLTAQDAYDAHAAARADDCPDCGRPVEYVNDRHRHVDPLATCWLYQIARGA